MQLILFYRWESALTIAMGFAALVLLAKPSNAQRIDRAWERHTIDNSSRGADGTRLADANGDGVLDVVTPWEQGDITRVYLNPGPVHVKGEWPAVTVGKTPDAEDAVLVDLDGDGAMDVVTCCEGQERSIFVHWAPPAGQYLDETKWTTVAVPASVNQSQWMFATPVDLDGDGQLDLVAGAKGNRARLGWWKLPEDPRKVKQWQWHSLRPVGWIMSIDVVDMDGDGDQDILFTDRKGKLSGCYWLQNPGPDQLVSASNEVTWKQFKVGAKAREAMFLSRHDVNDDGLEDVIIATRPHAIVICQRTDQAGQEWNEYEIAIPYRYGGSKSVAAGDLDGDGKIEYVFSTERATDGKIGVGRVINRSGPFLGNRKFTPISGVDGVKHDMVKLIDLDQDGDLDVLTSEETKSLGVIWYENPRS